MFSRPPLSHLLFLYNQNSLFGTALQGAALRRLFALQAILKTVSFPEQDRSDCDVAGRGKDFLQGRAAADVAQSGLTHLPFCPIGCPAARTQALLTQSKISCCGKVSNCFPLCLMPGVSESPFYPSVAEEELKRSARACHNRRFSKWPYSSSFCLITCPSTCRRVLPTQSKAFC